MALCLLPSVLRPARQLLPSTPSCHPSGLICPVTDGCVRWHQWIYIPDAQWAREVQWLAGGLHAYEEETWHSNQDLLSPNPILGKGWALWEKH